MNDVEFSWIFWYVKAASLVVGSLIFFLLLPYGFNMHDTSVLVIEVLLAVVYPIIAILTVRHLMTEFYILKDKK